LVGDDVLDTSEPLDALGSRVLIAEQEPYQSVRHLVII